MCGDIIDAVNDPYGMYTACLFVRVVFGGKVSTPALDVPARAALVAD
jgi:hypothetical protein